MKFSASIVLYKSDVSYINSIIEHITDTNFDGRLYLVDNSPTCSCYPIINNNNIEYIFNGNNIGFGSAHNLILKNKELLGKYHIIINPDIIINDLKIFDKIFNFMEKNPQIGLMMPKILYPNGEIQYLPKNLPSPKDLFIRNFIPLKSLQKKTNIKYEMRNYDHNKILYPSIISGCFSVLRTELIKKHNLRYDERFFMYFEDFDLSRRFAKVSQLIYFPYIEVIHEYQRGAAKSRKLFIIFAKSMIKYFNKWGWFFDTERRKK